MRKITIFVSLIYLAITSVCLAGDEVRIYKDYSPVRILYTFSGQNADLEASKAGLSGGYAEVDKSAIPADRTNRDFWKCEAGEIKIDTVKKKIADDAKTKKETDKKTGKEKLKATGLTEDELKALGIGGQ